MASKINARTRPALTNPELRDSAVAVSVGSLPLPAGGATSALQTAGNVSLAAMQAALDVALSTRASAAVQATIAGLQANAATSTVTTVAANIASVQLLAALAGRRGAAFYNDCDKACYLRLGTPASAAAFTVKLLAGAFYELPWPLYSGRVDGIWDAAPTGNLRITELTA